MKQLMILVAAFLVSSYSFADTQSLALNSPSKHAPSLKELSAAWKNQQYMHAQDDKKNDITIVYGGADISNRPALKLHTTTV